MSNCLELALAIVVSFMIIWYCGQTNNTKDWELRGFIMDAFFVNGKRKFNIIF